MNDPTLAYWLGFGTCLAMVAFVIVLAAVRMAGLCSQEERRGVRPDPPKHRPDPHIIPLPMRGSTPQTPESGRGA